MEAAESLFECLEHVADPRRARGVRHPFQAILRLTLLGLVCGQTTMAHSVGYGLQYRPLRQDALAGAEGASGVCAGPSTPRHHHLAHPGRGPL